MFSGRIACELAIVAVLCVISIFLFPVARGPYTAIHGPVTALQSVRAAARLRWLMIAAAFTRLRSLVKAMLSARATIFAFGSAASPPTSGLSTVLRC